MVGGVRGQVNDSREVGGISKRDSPPRIGYSHSTVTYDERMQRESSLGRETVSRRGSKSDHS
jgi:hypothetical protein